MEEATLRAKIQAMKNLLEAKRQSYGQYQSRKDAASGPVNRSWNRFSPPDAAVNQGNGSSNKTDEGGGQQEQEHAATGATTGRWRVRQGNGGFSLVRAGVKKSTPVTSAVATAKPMPVIRSNSNSVHIGGVKYVVANGGKVLKRCSTEERKANVAHRRGPMSITPRAGLLAPRYCKNKEECRFIHDSRRVAMCRKFLKNECNDPKCLLSHHHDEVEIPIDFCFAESRGLRSLVLPIDGVHNLFGVYFLLLDVQNKVPDCKMFLRGACTREGCKYRHVKVSATAELCEPFTKGYCPKGGACPLRHELPQITRSRPSTASGTLTSPCSEATNASPASSGPASASGSPKNGNGELSIRPNIRFASKHSTGFPSLFDGLRRSAKTPVLTISNQPPIFRAKNGGASPVPGFRGPVQRRHWRARVFASAEDEAAADFGIRMEQLTLRVQREIWSALASDASPSADAAVELARSFLRVAEDEDEIMYKSLPSNGRGEVLQATETNSTRLNKRPRDEAPEDLMIGQNTRNNSPTSEPGVTAPERPPLTKEMEDRASGLAKQLVQLSRSEATAAVDDVATRAFDMLAEVVNDVHTTYAANERSFQYMCKVLCMDSTSDEALSQITRYRSLPKRRSYRVLTPHAFSLYVLDSALVDSNWSSRYAAIFLETSVLPKIRAAGSVISRVLLQTALRFGSSYAGSLVDSLLLPLLVGGEHDDPNNAVGPPQAEAITRILRSPDTIPADQLDKFLQKSLEAVTANDKMDPHLLSNESALLVFQNILNTKPVLSALTVERLVGACEAVLERPEAEQVRGSLKFATVIFTLISKYPQQCAGHVETLEAIATQLTSIMAKTTLRSLQKLKTSK
ncbi:Zinc finger, CCCH-type [Phytophthora cactorum]|nr:Zinc finger, CCCH-type [Phytophthora cactorum]